MFGPSLLGHVLLDLSTEFRRALIILMNLGFGPIGYQKNKAGEGLETSLGNFVFMLSL